VTVLSVYNLNNLTGTTRISGANVDMSAATVTSLGANLVISGGSLNLGSSPVNLVTFNWSLGTVSGSGLISVNATLSMSGALTLSGPTLDNYGAAAWAAAGSLTGSGTFNNSGTLVKSGTGTTTTIGLSVFSNADPSPPARVRLRSHLLGQHPLLAAIPRTEALPSCFPVRTHLPQLPVFLEVEQSNS